MREMKDATDAARDRERPRSMRVLAVVLGLVWAAIVGLWIAGRASLGGTPTARPHATISAPPDPFLSRAANDAERALEGHLEALASKRAEVPRVWGAISPVGRRARLVVRAESGGRTTSAAAEGDPGVIADEVLRLADEAIAALDR